MITYGGFQSDPNMPKTCKGFGFVQFSNADDARTAKQLLDGADAGAGGGVRVACEYARVKEGTSSLRLIVKRLDKKTDEATRTYARSAPLCSPLFPRRAAPLCSCICSALYSALLLCLLCICTFYAPSLHCLCWAAFAFACVRT